MESQPADFNARQKPLENFRTKGKRLKVHPAELAALWIVGAHLVFLPWALGAMRAWAHHISLGLSLVGILVALLPRNYTHEHSSGGEFRLLTWTKLLKFPFFWLGLLFFGYLTAQGLNPAWSFQENPKVWWMVEIDHKAWLPRGYEAPYARWNIWRMIVIYVPAWLTVCTIWVAFTRRRTVQLFLIALGMNGLLLAIFGVIQRFTKTPKIFGFFESPNPQFFASFIYKNHGAAYLFLTLIITCGLAGWYYLRGLRRMEKSNPSGVLAFFATCIAVAILTSLARGVTITMVAFLLVCMIAFIIHQVLLPAESRKPAIAVALLLVFGYFLKVGFDTIPRREAFDRITSGVMREDSSLAQREMLTAASIEMLSDHWAAGLGAGSYAFLFPRYQHRHPDLLKTPDGQSVVWHAAHNDIVQTPIELGVAGMVILLTTFGYFAVRLVRNYFWENPLSSCLVFGAGTMVAYSWWDFPFQCPAIITTWWVLWPIAVMWAQFEESGAQS